MPCRPRHDDRRRARAGVAHWRPVCGTVASASTRLPRRSPRDWSTPGCRRFQQVSSQPDLSGFEADAVPPDWSRRINSDACEHANAAALPPRHTFRRRANPHTADRRTVRHAFGLSISSVPARSLLTIGSRRVSRCEHALIRSECRGWTASGVASRPDRRCHDSHGGNPRPRSSDFLQTACGYGPRFARSDISSGSARTWPTTPVFP